MCFDIKRLLSYFRKHYAERMRNYYALMLGSAGLPLLLAFVSRSSVTAASMAGAVELFVLAYVLYLSTVGMRSKRTMQIDNTMPLTNLERYAFIMINSTVVAMALFMVAYLPAVAIAKWVFPPEPIFDFVFEELFNSKIYYTAMFSTHAVLLVINLTARRRAYLGYVVAAVAIFVIQLVMSRYVPYEMREDARMWGNILLIIGGWGVGYPLLRYREIKM